MPCRVVDLANGPQSEKLVLKHLEARSPSARLHISTTFCLSPLNPLFMMMNSLIVPVFAHTFSVSKETLFATSLFPYLGFLWFLTRSRQVPQLALWGFYGTLVFVGITIPVGIYAQVTYGEALANVDWLHGGAELFLTLSNILVVLGFRQALKEHPNHSASNEASAPLHPTPRSSD